MGLSTIEKTEHDELLVYLKPLTDHLHANGFTFMLVAGKDGVCSRHMRGSKQELVDMLSSFGNDHKDLGEVIERVGKEKESK